MPVRKIKARRACCDTEKVCSEKSVCSLACAAAWFLCDYPVYQKAVGAHASCCAGAGGGARRCACKQLVAPSGVLSGAGGGMCGAYASICVRADVDVAADGDVDEPLRAY